METEFFYSHSHFHFHFHYHFHSHSYFHFHFSHSHSYAFRQSARARAKAERAHLLCTIGKWLAQTKMENTRDVMINYFKLSVAEFKENHSSSLSKGK